MPDKISRYDLQTTNLEHAEMRKPRTRTLRSDIVFTFALGIGLTVAWQLRQEIALLYISALFAVVLMPVLRGVQKIKIGKWSPGRGSAITIILLAVSGAITLFVLFALPPVARDAREFVKELPRARPGDAQPPQASALRLAARCRRSQCQAAGLRFQLRHVSRHLGQHLGQRYLQDRRRHRSHHLLHAGR